MLQKFELSAIHIKLDDNLKKYVTKKLAGVDKYLNKAIRPSAHLEVHLKEEKIAGQLQCVCEATLYLPHDSIRLSEATQNMYAAVDIVEAKLKQQVEKYKEKHMTGKRRRHLFSRLRGEVA